MYDNDFIPDRKRLEITKMHFCNQVELQENEYSLNKDMIVLMYNNKTFLEAEFSLVNSSGDALAARLCMEDADMHMYSRSNSEARFDPENAVLIAALLSALAMSSSILTK